MLYTNFIQSALHINVFECTLSIRLRQDSMVYSLPQTDISLCEWPPVST